MNKRVRVYATCSLAIARTGTTPSVQGGYLCAQTLLYLCAQIQMQPPNKQPAKHPSRESISDHVSDLMTVIQAHAQTMTKSRRADCAPPTHRH